MANYPVVPGPRMPWSIDGTIAFSSSGSTVTEYDSTVREDLNDETGDRDIAFSFFGNNPQTVFGVVFPQLRDLTGFFLACNQVCAPVEVSTTTTTGLDGTWTILRNTAPLLTMFPFYRTSISVTSAPRIKALRFTTPTTSNVSPAEVYTLHLYGSIVTGQAPASRIGFWHPSLDQALPGSWFDWGDVARSSTATKTFRLRNLSATQTANNVALSTVAPTDLTPSAAGAHAFSLDGTTFTSTVNITAISANSYSPVITVRRTLSSTQPLSLFAFRFQTAVTSWS